MPNESTSAPLPATRRSLLHVGCGPNNPARLPSYFQQDHWHEIRLDIDPQVAPDILASITDLSQIPSSSIDAVWSSHNLEHLHAFEVPTALAELQRVLKPDGFLLATLPDLGAIARHLLHGDLEDTLYHSAAGPIAALDILFGHQASIAAGKTYMAHRTGFTSDSLGRALIAAGFTSVSIHEGKRWDLWALATQAETPENIAHELGDLVR